MSPVKYDAVNVVSLWVVANKGIYDSSVALGRENVIGQVGRYYWDCGGKTRVVLAGYSQGGDVVGDALEKMFAKYPKYVSIVDGVIMLGDPKFKASASHYNSGNYITNLNGVYASVHGVKRSLSASQGQRVHSYCIHADPICNWGGVAPNQHFAYQNKRWDSSQTYTQAAAAFLASRVRP